jgi:hypothetical protein
MLLCLSSPEEGTKSNSSGLHWRLVECLVIVTVHVQALTSKPTLGVV